MHNEQDLKNTPEYRSGMFRIVTCPVCGYPTLDMYWICEHCGWEYDIELQTEDAESPCNGMSLRAYRELYKTGGISMNVTICSRKAAEELLRTDTLSRTAVISFCDPPSVGKPAPTPPLDYAGKAARVFTVVVHDLDLTALPDVGLDYDTYMPEADALAAFICQARADGLDILCQCEYGQSRSAACVQASGDGLELPQVFTVVVHDLDLTALPDVGLDYDTYMPEADALAAFICQARSDGLDILCQCEYGQSRSAACAAAILEYFNGTGTSVFADYRYYPNQVVYHKIMDALTRYGQEAQPSA